ncbi:hypothetical protein [Mariniblastus fucicola]|uniref:Uncharacterized protein n=1 Tax=Mariniblastus fucicola TaxID=980251 RepID=A0A5B9P8R0_9BACT|nr:hypothetical protein [Mariniblastus fucicola]QEG22744.1 hypothetical protein MFFC18_26270 [Mariniblastus fucicola]
MANPNAMGRLLHPALFQLMKFQSTGKLRRIGNAFRSRRKLVLSLLAILLGCVWLGQTVLSIVFRDPADPESLRTWLSVSMLLYCVFHFLKIGSRKPVEPFEWTAAEKQALLSAPLTRTHLVSYRLISYLLATAAKSLCFAIVMIPDLPSFTVGAIGMFLGLSLIDLTRVLLERIAWTAASTSKRCWTIVRATMLVPALTLLTVAFYQTAWSPDFEAAIASPNPLSIPQLFLAIVSDVVGQPPFSWLLAPWVAVVDIVLATQYDWQFLTRTMAVISSTITMSALIYWADQKGTWWQTQLSLRKRTHRSAVGRSENRESNHRAKSPTGMGGAKAIIWHQVHAAIHYRSTLAFALAIPTLLSCMPLLSKTVNLATSLSVIGSMVFYSFLLLPPALMLDFRRNAQRLAMWKAMPIRPIALTFGQLSVPVALMSLFQACVLAIAVLIGGHSPLMFLAWPMLLPLNVLIIGMENAIFLMQPYRRNQEGIEVFFRTILTFTGKGVMFAVGLAFTLVWAWAAISIGKVFESQILGASIFGAGVLVALFVLAWASAKTCARLFEKLDVSQDLPPA